MEYDADRYQDRCLNKLRILTDQAEKLLFDALRTQPPSFSLVDPLWSTWTLEHFGMLTARYRCASR